MRALLVYNPTAGRSGTRREIPDAVAVLSAAGWLIMPAQTQGPNHAAELARQACADGYDVVLVAGGDGTVNQVANGLITAASEGLPLAALGLLPAGTANVLARDLGYARARAWAEGHVARGRPPPVEVDPRVDRRRAGKWGSG